MFFNIYLNILFCFLPISSQSGLFEYLNWILKFETPFCPLLSAANPKTVKMRKNNAIFIIFIRLVYCVLFMILIILRIIKSKFKKNLSNKYYIYNL